ncbi:MAG: peptidoglycan D,D-transpeptidase FtsI family protein [Gammaproteobacteria bacterium]
MIKIRLIFVLIFVLFILPLIKYFQLKGQEERILKEGISRVYTEKEFTTPRRKILDRNSIELATDIRRDTFIFSSNAEKEKVIEFSNKRSIGIFLNANKRIWFQNPISSSFYNDSKEYCGCKIIREEKYRRYYPFGSVASTLLGFAGTEGGLEGVERVFNSRLLTKSEKRKFIKDARQRIVMGDINDFIDNEENSLTLTLDINLQYKLQEELEKAVAMSESNAGAAILLDSSNGDILAVANFPTYNPNDPERKITKNIAFNQFYEPGSLMKPVTIAGAIKYGHVDFQTSINTNPGRLLIPGKVITEAGGKNHGEISLTEVITLSSQVGTTKIGLQFDDRQIYENLENFGFGKNLNNNFTNGSGKILIREKYQPTEKAAISYGYSVEVNTVQLARAYTVFANEGVMVEPKILLDEPAIKKQVITQENAKFILDALRTVVTQGTARRMKNIDVEIVGKTGTTEKYFPGKGKGYTDGKYVSSFAAIFPYENPKYVLAITFDEPDPNNYYGGTISAPLVRSFVSYLKRTNYL